MLQMCLLPFLVPILPFGQLLYNSDNSKQVPGKTGCCELVCPKDILGCQMETRRKTISTKYRTAENAAGAPAATTNPPLKKRRKIPARIERSQIRLEKFLKKKANDKNQAENSLGNQAVGSSPSRLVIDLNKQEGEKGDRSVVAGQPSPIPQVDGEVKS